MFNYEVKFLTCHESLQLQSGDLKTYKYETKNKMEESVFETGKKSFCERRGGYWRSPRPRQLRQLESKLRDRTVVFCDWANEGLVTMVFSSGAIAYITVKPETLDVTQILFDRYCVGKLSGQTVTGVIMCKSHLLFTHADRMATLISFGKATNNELPCRISDRDPHLQSIELGGGARRTERKVSWCEHGKGIRVLVWGSAAAEPAPWSPALEDLANLHLYHIQGKQIKLVTYQQLENDTLSAELDHKDNFIHIVEQLASHKTGLTLDWLRYEVPTQDQVSKLSALHSHATQAALPAPARVVRRAPGAARLLAACIDGSLHVVHRSAGLVHSTRAGFIATEVRWAGELVVAAEEAGRLQCFDRALSLLHHHAKCIDLTPHVRIPVSFIERYQYTASERDFPLWEKEATHETYRDARRMQLLCHKNMKSGPLILASFTGGPLFLLRIKHPRLLTAWMRSGRTANAVALLRSLDWSTEGTECLWATSRLVCAALRAGLQGGSGEAAAQAALGSFLAPTSPHGGPARRFAPPVHDLARKFFHHLLRRGRIEKAMSLAVDLADWDLFADARWAAARRALPAVAEEAATLAAHYAIENGQESECSDSCSECSSHSYSGSEVETSSSEAVKTIPPPLPRVPLPQNAIPVPITRLHLPQTPTIMPVPITQAEPTSTLSIRPNLHQYLDRDNTIWSTAVKTDASVRGNGYGDHVKPTLNAQMKWHSVDNVLMNYKMTPMHGLLPISEVPSRPSRPIIEISPRDERPTPHFRHLYQTELREDGHNTLYRYQNSCPSSSMADKTYRLDGDGPERPNRLGEKNKVKFSDTVTVAVVPEPQPCPSPARELADSLPLCAPHKYLAAFTPLPAPLAAPAPAPAGTALDYIEV